MAAQHDGTKTTIHYFQNLTTGEKVEGQERRGGVAFSERERDFLLAGGLLRYLKQSA